MLPFMRYSVLPFALSLAICISTTGTSLAAGPSSAPAGSLSEPPPNFQLEDVTIELERTGCYGTCPAYRLVIRGSGQCTYSGIHHVHQTGEVGFSLDQKVVVELLNEFYAIDFFRLRDQYTQGHYIRLLPNGKLEHSSATIADVPHTIVRLTIAFYSKSVEEAWDMGPQDLTKLSEKIDLLTNSSRWTQPPSR